MKPSSIGAALLTSKPIGGGGTWSTALIYGANDEIGAAGLQNSVVFESTLEPDHMNSFFGRAEYVRKSAGELLINDVPTHPRRGRHAAHARESL